MSATATETISIPVSAPTPDVAASWVDTPIESEGTYDHVGMGDTMPRIPTFTDPYSKRTWIKQKMAGAFRIFARKGFTEGLAGHISVRDPLDPHTFWINPLGVHFGLIKASDMVRVDENGKLIEGNKRAINTAGFMIHSALHRTRPEVNAACHTHSINAKTWSAFGKPIEMLNQDACMFYKDAQTVYSQFGGVVVEREESDRLAASTGSAKAIILQNHGLLTVGKTVDEAAFLFTSYEKLCEAQLKIEAAAANGLKKQYISDKSAQFTFDETSTSQSLYYEFQVDYAYELAQDPSFLQ